MKIEKQIAKVGFSILKLVVSSLFSKGSFGCLKSIFGIGITFFVFFILLGLLMPREVPPSNISTKQEQENIQQKQVLQEQKQVITKTSQTHQKISKGWTKEEIERKAHEEVELEKRQKIFFQLVEMQDLKEDDPQWALDCYKKIAEKFDITEKEVRQIAVEGAKNRWRMPDK